MGDAREMSCRSMLPMVTPYSNHDQKPLFDMYSSTIESDLCARFACVLDGLLAFD